MGNIFIFSWIPLYTTERLSISVTNDSGRHYHLTLLIKVVITNTKIFLSHKKQLLKTLCDYIRSRFTEVYDV